MINVNALKGAIAENNLSQRQLAKKLGMTENTFYRKMSKAKFDSDEMNGMIKELRLTKDNAINIFFANTVT